MLDVLNRKAYFLDSMNNKPAKLYLQLLRWYERGITFGLYSNTLRLTSMMTYDRFKFVNDTASSHGDASSLWRRFGVKEWASLEPGSLKSPGSELSSAIRSTGSLSAVSAGAGASDLPLPLRRLGGVPQLLVEPDFEPAETPPGSNASMQLSGKSRATVSSSGIRTSSSSHSMPQASAAKRARLVGLSGTADGDWEFLEDCVRAPQQDDAYSCGVFVIMFALQLCMGEVRGTSTGPTDTTMICLGVWHWQ